MLHLLIAGLLFVVIPFALVGGAALWEKLTDEEDFDESER
jgi:hypothetical protein